VEEMITYTNPVLPGFYPDPSICRVGQDYYLVTSSFEYFPGVPIFHSRDLVHWRQIGYCLTRASQLLLAGVRSSGGIFAPTIRYHNGLFYMVTTNVPDGGNFYVFTDDPAGEWSEPVHLRQGGIDPSLCFDGERVYLTGSDGWPNPSIYQCEIDIKSGQQLTETRLLWRGSGGRYPEGPHLYHIGDWYYLMIAEGGTEYGHMETVARSRSPWGPFEACPHNPILTHRNHGTHPLQGTGHADLIEAHDGSWWLVFLAFRPQHGNYHHLGRETCLAPLTWTEDGWPVVSAEKTVDVNVQTNVVLPQQKVEAEPVRDDFVDPYLRLCWNFLRNPYAEDWSLTERPGWLRLYGSSRTLDSLDSPAFVGRRQQHFQVSVRTLLEFRPEQEGHEAGLTVLMNEQHHYEIAVTLEHGERCVIVRRRIGDLVAIVTRTVIEEGPIELEIRAESDSYSFLYAKVGEPMRRMASGATRYLSTEVAGGFTGVYLGMYATGNGGGKTSPADFDWFEYRLA
jgi:xylan 1,4-beta-xylosidase